jgi:hypothetical protein
MRRAIAHALNLYPAFTECRIHLTRSNAAKAFSVNNLICFTGPKEVMRRKSCTWIEESWWRCSGTRNPDPTQTE